MNGEHNKALEDFKQEYRSIPVPKEARERMIAGISQAKKEKRGVILMNFAKKTGTTAAAAIAAITILANLSPTTAQAMEQIPFIGSVAKVVTFRTFEQKSDHYEAQIQIPQIEAADPSLGSPAVNKSIEEYANELIASYEKEIAALGEEGHYSLDSTYEVATDNSRYLCLRFNVTETAASGAQSVKIFTIDKRTGKEVSLSELLKDRPEVLEAAGANIGQQMEAQMAADENISYFYHSDMPEDDFKGLSGNESYYFNNQGELVIVFDEYQVAPGYMGAVEFAIPTSVTGTFF